MGVFSEFVCGAGGRTRWVGDSEEVGDSECDQGSVLADI